MPDQADRRCYCSSRKSWEGIFSGRHPSPQHPRSPKLRFLHQLTMRGIHTATWLTQRATMGAQIALVDGSNILLVKHIYKPGWHLPGGGIDPPEAPAQAATRELFEETGYLVQAEPKLLGIFSNATAATSRDYVTIFASDQFAPPSDDHRRSREIAEIRWFAVHQLPPACDQMCQTAVKLLAAEHLLSPSQF